MSVGNVVLRDVVDLMIGFPIRDRKAMYERLMKAGLKDQESRQEFNFPAEYMFKDVPGEADDIAGESQAEIVCIGVMKGRHATQELYRDHNPPRGHGHEPA